MKKIKKRRAAAMSLFIETDKKIRNKILNNCCFIDFQILRGFEFSTHLISFLNGNFLKINNFFHCLPFSKNL